MKGNVFLFALAAVLLLATGCATDFTGPQSYVSFSTGDSQIMSAGQSSKVYQQGELQSTYDDEFEYDGEGNLLSHRQIQYFNDSMTDNKYVVWETEYKVIGGEALPYRVMVNDVVYLQVDYQLLNSGATGAVTQPIKYRSFIQHRYRNGLWGATYPFEWGIDLRNYPVDFATDGRFVVKDWVFSLKEGYHAESVLALGQDNIVLTHYSFSDEKLLEGFKKSYTGMIPMNIRQRSTELAGSNYSFDYDWEVINDKICQTGVTFRQTYKSFNIYFESETEYNDSGNPIQETWKAAESDLDEDNVPKVIFQNSFEY